MKKLFTVIALLCAWTGAFAQYGPFSSSPMGGNSVSTDILHAIFNLSDIPSASLNKMHNQNIKSYTTFNWSGGGWGDTVQHYEYVWSGGKPLSGSSYSYSGWSRTERLEMTNFVLFHNNGGLGTMTAFYPTKAERATNSGSKWEVMEKYTIAFTTDGKISSVNTEKLNTTTQKFEPSQKTEYSYDTYGNYLGNTTSAYTGGQWVISSGYRYKLKYDGNNKISESTKEVYSTILTNWAVHYYEFYKRDASGKIIGAQVYNQLKSTVDSLYFNWYNFKDEINYNDDHNEYAFKTLGKPYSIKYLRKTGAKFKFTAIDSLSYNSAGKVQTEIVLDSLNHIMERLSYSFYPNNDLNVFSHKKIKDTTYQLYEFEAGKYVNIYDSKNDPVEKIWMSGNDSLNLFNQVKETFTFYGGTGIEDDSRTDAFRIYPVPANNLVNIVLDQNARNLSVRIADLSGKVVMVENNKNTTRSQVNVSQLPAGSYIISIDADGVKSHRPLIKN